MTGTEHPLHPLQATVDTPGCSRCRDLPPLAFDFSMAFQPIVDLGKGETWGWEALVRGPGGQGAATVLSQVTDENRYPFDQQCRIRAIELAQKLGLSTRLSINFLPNAVYEPKACIRATIEAANRVGFPLNRLQFEITEVEEVRNDGHLRRIVEEYRAIGFATAIDDFGAGYAGLNLLTHFQPDTLKLDMNLIRNIDQDPVRQAIVCGIVLVCQRLSIDIVADGIETSAESAYLRSLGVRYPQGYLFAKPGWESLPLVPRHA